MDTERLAQIELQLKIIPHTPGVYMIRDPEDVVIYVGKAKNLQYRLRQHFAPSATFSKSRRIRERGSRIEVFEVNNEKEALLLEYNLIQEHSPMFNDRWKDGKTYPYVELTAGEEFPRIRVTRSRDNPDSIYLGPFSEVKSVRKTIKFALKLFPIADCSREISLGDSETWAKRCFRRRMKTCHRPCEVVVDKHKYSEDVERVIMFLEGKQPDLAEQIEAMMKEASANLEFEKAAELRDVLNSLRRTIESQTIFVSSVDTFVLSMAEDEMEIALEILEIREQRVVNHFQHFAGKEGLESVSDFVASVILNVIGREPRVNRILNATGDLDVAEVLTSLGFKVVKINPKEREIAKLANHNAKRFLNRRQLMRKSGATPADKVEDLRRILGLDSPPLIIDTFDVSTLQGVSNVASCVRFRDGKPYKQGYRKFHIRSVEGQDDFASMEEAVYRRYLSIQEGRDSEGLPDLIVIDGGSEQLYRASVAIEKLGLTIPIIGLAKREEEIYLPDQEVPLQFSKTRPALLLLRSGRDEAHRFAVTFQRSTREKEGLRSLIDGVRGIGTRRKASIFEKYPSIKEIARASAETMKEELGIPQKVASELISEARKYMDRYYSRERRRRR